MFGGVDFGFLIGYFVDHQAIMARYAKYFETPHNIEPHDSCLHQPYAFAQYMLVVNGVNEPLAVAYE